jgi:hypothetical protein
MTAKRLLLGMLALATACTGCGKAPPRVEVRGRVTVGGRPLTESQITFLLEPGQPPGGPNGMALTDGDGNYRLTGTDGRPGVAPGWYRITVLGAPSGPFGKAKSPQKSGEQSSSRVSVAIPKDLQNVGTTPLKREVTGGGPQVIDLEL